MDEMYTIPLPSIVKELSKELSSLPDSDDVSRWDLETRRKIYLDDDIGCYNVMEIQRLILRWNMEDAAAEEKTKTVNEKFGFDHSEFKRQPIWIYIMSYGGDLDYMWSMIDIITASKTPVYTVNVGVAASAASLIFLAGHKRFMMKRSHLIIHEGAAQLAGDAIKVIDQSESYKEQLKQMKEFILERTHIPRNQLLRKRNNDWYIDAAYCLEHNACEQIVDSLDDII